MTADVRRLLCLSTPTTIAGAIFFSLVFRVCILFCFNLFQLCICWASTCMAIDEPSPCTSTIDSQIQSSYIFILSRQSCTLSADDWHVGERQFVCACGMQCAYNMKHQTFARMRRMCGKWEDGRYWPGNTFMLGVMHSICTLQTANLLRYVAWIISYVCMAQFGAS